MADSISISIENTKRSKQMPEREEFLFGGLHGPSTSENLPIYCPQPIKRTIITEIFIQEDDTVGLDILCDSPPPRPKNPQIPLMVSPSSLVGPGSLCGSWLIRSNKPCIPKISLSAALVSTRPDVTSPEVNSPKFRVSGFDVKSKDN